MKIIVGLGNPGAKYAGTRHNVGFAVLDELAERHNIRIDTAKHKALIGKGIIDGEKVILAMPQTFMNLSGESVKDTREAVCASCGGQGGVGDSAGFAGVFLLREGAPATGLWVAGTMAGKVMTASVT